MTPKDVETVYEALALRLDDVGAQKREIFLAKLALLLSYDIGDAEKVCQRIAEASRNIDA